MDYYNKKTVAILTLGCKVNQYESNAMAQKFWENGYNVVEFGKKADIYIINTCTVTNISDKKSRQMLRRARQMNEDALIIAVGCYVQVSRQEVENIDEIDLILGNNEKKNIIEIINNYEKNKKKDYVDDLLKVKEFADFGSISYTEKTRAVIKVQDGCDRFCSYCIIPYARGRVRSRSIQSVVDEIEEVVKKGIKEVVITGIHIASFGKDFKDNIGLIDLLEKINAIEGLERIRLGSIEPTLITKEFVNRLRELKKICEHFHLSLQSGCDDTLKRMNRRYTTSEFIECVNLLRKTYDNVVLTTDIIVGFPGETEEEFEKTYDFLKEINFYQLHVFKYSKRNGTKASIMDNQIEPEIKEERSKKLIELSKMQKRKIQEKMIGKIYDVLWEQEIGDHIKGHTSNYVIVYANKDEGKENEIKKVKFEKIYKDGMFGNVVNPIIK